ncbi:hypothetical protein H9P43_005869 [Blastocladiella emersonii ATCC 22665]|nr:hypothetical protein H9P43_005869 [Blastocladiella emersonii ATCC 22665]
MGNQYSTPLDPNAPVELRHFHLGRVIGKGAFGKVRVVERRSDKKIYALKYMNKEHIIKQRAYRNIIRERYLLERIFHPFIVNLCYAFQDDDHLFMVSDLMLGGDLRFHLSRNDTLAEPLVVFYGAEVASALIYLHSRDIIHRDIKPDNLLLDSAGHVHVTDFNCACFLEDGKAIVSETGTQGYMAPEVYTEVGYRESVDWWSLGVTLFELLHGERPFTASTLEELAWAVKNEPIQWRAECSPEMLNFVLSLMDRNVARRLGCGHRGPLDIKEHNLMLKHDIDWNRLVNKEIPPPFVPDTTAMNFDARYELEELLLEDSPLVARPRKKNGGAGSNGSGQKDHPMARELGILEAEYTHFDYEIFGRYTGIVDPTKASVGEPPSWVRCVDPPVPLPPSTAPSSPNLAASEPLEGVEPGRAIAASMDSLAITANGALRHPRPLGNPLGAVHGSTPVLRQPATPPPPSQRSTSPMPPPLAIPGTTSQSPTSASPGSSGNGSARSSRTTSPATSSTPYSAAPPATPHSAAAIAAAAAAATPRRSSPLALPRLLSGLLHARAGSPELHTSGSAGSLPAPRRAHPRDAMRGPAGILHPSAPVSAGTGTGASSMATLPSEEFDGGAASAGMGVSGRVSPAPRGVGVGGGSMMPLRG